MAITFDQKSGVFHLRNDKISYVLQVTKDRYLLHRYWGKSIRMYRESAPLVFLDRGFSPNPTPNDRTFSLDTLPMEFPTYGNGDFRTPAFEAVFSDGSGVTDFRYVSHRITEGKPTLSGLPATYVEHHSEAQTLEITVRDAYSDLEAVLSYTVFEQIGAITRSVRLQNRGSKPVRLLRVLSASVDFRNDEYDLLTLDGAHASECHMTRRRLAAGTQLVDSCRGASSHQHNPFLALLRPNADEEKGEIYGFHLVYSGNFLAQAQVDQFHTARVSIGINPFNFEWLLRPEESFQSPEAVLAYSDAGLDGLSQVYHKLYREQLCRGKFRDMLRPILVNSWEASYFDFDTDSILKLAREAKDVGVELVVLDDGWFGKRDDDKSSLGDWVVNRKKLPDGLDALGRSLHEMGLQFGLWLEPEMVSMDSDLYRAHPDWCLHVNGRPYTWGRSQLVLDLSREDVRAYIINTVSDILANAPIDYVKWDMNRHMTEIGSSKLPPDRQRETAHRYILGLYSVLDAITTRFPNVLFESCSGGGGRFDPGLLYYMPQTWASDNTDAVCRLKIQYGTSITYPPSSICSHVSVSPNEQVGRMTPLQTRGYVAMSGNFGYELDFGKLTNPEKEEMRRQVALSKEIRPLVQFGVLHRLLNPFQSNEAAWIYVAQDGSEAVVFYFKVLAQPAAPIRILHLRGLDPAAEYRDLESGKTFGGDELLSVGLTVPVKSGDFTSQFWHLKRTESVKAAP